MEARIRGISLFYDRVGDGAPMLMMHGGLGLDHSLLRSHDVLADRFQLTYYDHRGHGRSDLAAAGVFEQETLHDDAAALLDHLGLQRSVIYGHSYGAMLALGFACRYPERVSALVLVGCTAIFDYGELVMAAAVARDPAVAARFAELLSTNPASDDEFRDWWPRILPLYCHAHTPSLAEAFAGIRYNVRSYATGNALMATMNLLPHLAAITCPTLLIAGDDDFITPLAQHHRIAAGVRDAEVSEIAACGHFPFLEQPASYFAALRGWLERRALPPR